MPNYTQTGLKVLWVWILKDENAEFICECSDIDDIIVFLKSGKYKVIKISEKDFVGKDIIYVGVFKRTMKDASITLFIKTESGDFYVRFAVTGATRDKVRSDPG